MAETLKTGPWGVQEAEEQARQLAAMPAEQRAKVEAARALLAKMTEQSQVRAPRISGSVVPLLSSHVHHCAMSIIAAFVSVRPKPLAITMRPMSRSHRTETEVAHRQW